MSNPITIHLNNAGKKFGREWIFRHVSLLIKPGEKLVILGLNGSGKSTLLQAMTGYLMLNEGDIQFNSGGEKINDEEIYRFMSLASPYLELIEDFTLKEQIEHAAIYKPFLPQLSTNEILKLSGLENHKNKHIRLFSSGMKQRVKLTLAISANAPLLFLDEPTSNLDATVIDWYKNMIETYAMNKTIVVCSNSIKEEYSFCDHVITMEDFKL